MEHEKVRVYGKCINKLFDDFGKVKQVEIEYFDYSLKNASLIGSGSEVFSSYRYGKEVIAKSFKLNQGKATICGTIKFRKYEKKFVKKYLKVKYKGYELELRGW